MKNNPSDATHSADPDWRSAQIGRLRTMADALHRTVAVIETKSGEIASLRKAVCNSARTSGRKHPQMIEVADLMETTFHMTSLCHLGTARCIATDMNRLLEYAIACLSRLQAEAPHTGTPCNTLGETTEQLLGHCARTARTLLQLLAHAEQEIETLQAALVAFST